MDVREAIAKRKSVRAYKDETVPEEVVKEILEAARRAPSVMNRQEWAFVVIRDKEVKKQIMEAVIQIDSLFYIEEKKLLSGGLPLEVMSRAISEITGQRITVEDIGKQANLKELLHRLLRHEVEQKFKAGLLIAVFKRLRESLSPSTSGCYDVGAAIENMLLVATSYGYGSLWMGGLSRIDAKMDWRPVGEHIRPFFRDRIGEILHAPADMELAALVFVGRSAEDKPYLPRKPLEEIAFLDRYGNPWKMSQ